VAEAQAVNFVLWLLSNDIAMVDALNFSPGEELTESLNEPLVADPQYRTKIRDSEGLGGG
jgi:hypothetical protein